jgi:hypothetical protein
VTEAGQARAIGPGADAGSSPATEVDAQAAAEELCAPDTTPACRVTKDGHVFVWASSGANPVRLQALEPAQRVFCERELTCAQAPSSAWTCVGETGLGGDSHTPVVIPVPDIDDLQSNGDGGLCATARGELWCWGRVMPPIDLGVTPKRIAVPGRVIKLAMGQSIVALTTNHDVYCFGDNEASVCGVKDADADRIVTHSHLNPVVRVVKTPHRIATRAIDIGISGYNACILRDDGVVLVTGMVEDNVAGPGIVRHVPDAPEAGWYNMALLPVRVNLPEKASAISPPSHHSSSCTVVLASGARVLVSLNDWSPLSAPAASRCP